MEMLNFARTVRGLCAALCCFIFITLLHPSASAQKDFQPATATNAKQFVGVWKATFQGNAFMTVALTTEKDKLVGTMSHANIEVNKDGELTKAEASDGEDQIADLRVKGNILRITIKTTEGDSIQSGLTLTAADEAELQMLVPPDVPTPKAWTTTRATWGLSRSYNQAAQVPSSRGDRQSAA
jgi:hypothetical protein